MTKEYTDVRKGKSDESMQKKTEPTSLGEEMFNGIDEAAKCPSS